MSASSPAIIPRELSESTALLPEKQDARVPSKPDPPPGPALDPVVPTAVAEITLDLETALGLAGGENPTIALAREAVSAGLADQLRARSQLLPTLEAGVSFNWHRGNLISAQGVITNVDRQSVYAGAGAAAVGAGTVGFPGVHLYGHLADALFDPATAQRRVTELSFAADATRNYVLLEVATHYFALTGAEARLDAIRKSEREFGEVVTLTGDFALKGQGREGDAERARGAALLLHADALRAEEDVAIAAAELSRLLTMDPAVRLHTPDGATLVEVVDPRIELEALIQTAVQNRPEIGASTAAVAVQETQLRKERLRPLLPFFTVGYSAGDFGGGSDQADSRFGHFRGRTDFDAAVVWSLQNFGAGNFAAQRRRRAEVGEAQSRRIAILDQVRREVAEAHAEAAASRREVDVAARRVLTAERAFRADLIRAKNLQGRPIELLNSLNLLNVARQDLVRAVAAFNQAQMRLFVSLGQPPYLATIEHSICNGVEQPGFR